MTQDLLAARFSEIRPRALAALTRQFRDIDLAEEAFADACLKAVVHWGKNGPPDNPLAWLLFVARNAGIDRLRKVKRQDAVLAGPPDDDMWEENLMSQIDQNGMRDDVLRLLFMCCHPALKRQDQLAIALKVVAGLSVAEIAQACLVKPKAMEQRITRAKRAIADNPVPFEPPDLVERQHRLTEVSRMVYLMFNEGWSASSGEVQIKGTLCEEAIRLARLLLDLFAGIPEQMGLLALLLLQHSRKAARMDRAGQLVSLDQQDRGLWDQDVIAEARFLVSKARRHGALGPYQIQAEIAEIHAVAASDDQVDWHRVEALYRALYLTQPSPVVRLNQAVAVSKTRGAEAALDIVDLLASDLSAYRWFHTARAGFLIELGRLNDAKAALRRALSLEPTAPERRAMETQIAELSK